MNPKKHDYKNIRVAICPKCGNLWNAFWNTAKGVSSVYHLKYCKSCETLFRITIGPKRPLWLRRRTVWTAIHNVGMAMEGLGYAILEALRRRK